MRRTIRYSMEEEEEHEEEEHGAQETKKCA